MKPAIGRIQIPPYVKKNTPVTIDTTLLKETYSPGDSRQMINTAGSGIFYLHLAPPAPEVKTFKTGVIANYAGNAMDCPLAATFENTADDTPVKLYITAQENGTSYPGGRGHPAGTHCKPGWQRDCHPRKPSFP